MRINLKEATGGILFGTLLGLALGLGPGKGNIPFLTSKPRVTKKNAPLVERLHVERFLDPEQTTITRIIEENRGGFDQVEVKVLTAWPGEKPLTVYVRRWEDHLTHMLGQHVQVFIVADRITGEHYFLAEPALQPP